MSDGDTTVAIRSLNDDFTCIVNTYLPRYKTNSEKISPENNIDCPFGELGLIDIANKKKELLKNNTFCEIIQSVGCIVGYSRTITGKNGNRIK